MTILNWQAECKRLEDELTQSRNELADHKYHHAHALPDQRRFQLVRAALAGLFLDRPIQDVARIANDIADAAYREWEGRCRARRLGEAAGKELAESLRKKVESCSVVWGEQSAPTPSPEVRLAICECPMPVKVDDNDRCLKCQLHVPF